MDNHQVFDNVKFEKAKAIARFNRFQNMMKTIQFLEVLVALMFVSWSWTRIPVVIKLSGEFLFELSVYLFKPHVVFLIGNAIIVAIVVLCRQTDAGNNSVSTTDLYDDDEVRGSEVTPPIVTTTSSGDVSVSSYAPVPEIERIEDKQIVCLESKVPEKQCDDEVATAIETAKKQIRKFQRTQSEKLKREIMASPRPELRRCETDKRRIVVRPGDRNPKVPVEAVDTLSSEEFKLTIEAFIKKNQIFFEKQRIAETEQEKYEQIGIEAF